jgi:polysaccharide export outer membrane protein
LHIVKLHLLTPFVALALASCAHTPPFAPGPHLTLTEAQALPPPAGVDPNSEVRPYRIGPFDTLTVNVFGVSELSQKVQVDSGGRISLPLIGGLDAQGRTPDELAREIAGRLRGRYLKDPQVSVNLEDTVSQVVTVDGQVREPGLYPVVGRMTLVRAVATAKGATEFAKLEDVVVFRKVGDRDMAALYNLQAIRRGMYPDPEIYANDVIVVGDSPARRMFKDVLQAGGLIATPIVAILQNL